MQLRLLLELLIRSSALLLAAALLLRVSRRQSAALRHRLALFTFLLLALLPLFSLVLPAFALPAWPHRALRAVVTVQQFSLTTLSAGAGKAAFDWTFPVWLAGVVMGLLPLLAGLFSIHRVLRGATPLTDPAWAGLLRELSLRSGETVRPQLLLSSRARIPFVCGFRRKFVLLPPEALAWCDARRRAVLAHELAHLRRHDLAAQIFAHLVTALWWFQPLAWLLRRSLQLESELACDTAALSSGLPASAYAAELLGFAHRSRSGAQPASVVIGIARPGGLEHRVRTLLAPPAHAAGLHSTLRIGVALALLASVALAASTLTRSSDRTSFQGGSFMKRSIFTALLTSAGLSAATVSGSLSDSKGAAVPDAKVVLSNTRTGAQQEAVSGADGRFDLNNAPAGTYILQVQKPGFGSIFRAFNLAEDARIDRGLTLPEGSTTADPNSVSAPEPGAKRVRVGGQVAQSDLLTKIQPVYPSAAKSAHVQGTVELDTVISKEGVPTEIRVLKSPSDDLSESALEAVSQWRYQPVLLNGNPIEVETTVIVNYTLTQ